MDTARVQSDIDIDVGKKIWENGQTQARFVGACRFGCVDSSVTRDAFRFDHALVS